jgi:hypothetical protein
MRIIIACLIGLMALPLPAPAGQGPDFSDRPLVGHPLRFTSEAGAVFRPRTLIVITRTVTVAAALPATATDAYSQDRVDLSGTPFLGQFFRPRLSPADAARDGIPAGPLFRFGDTLVLDSRAASVPIDGLDLVLTADFPRDGLVSYHLDAPRFTATALPQDLGERAGSAFVLDGRLVLAGQDGGAPIRSWSRIFGAKP